MTGWRRFLAGTVCVAAMPCITTAGAQVDTARRVTLDSMRIVAERAPRSLGSASTSISRLSGEEIARMPHRSLADLLRLVPGFGVVDRDGMGFDPQVMVRGFYGGGETEYVLVLVDGRPVTMLQSGLAGWDALPPIEAIAAIEIMRGSASPLYGDAALGAVVNVITRAPAMGAATARWSLAGGGYDSWRGGAAIAATPFDRPVSLSAAVDRTGGFRAHSARTSGRAVGTIRLAAGERGSLSLTARAHAREFDEPGALLESYSTDRSASDPLFRFDGTRDDAQAIGVDGDRRLSDRVRFSASALAEHRDMRMIRTLALAPGFGDTRERTTGAMRFWGTAQVAVNETPLPWRDNLVVGTDLARGSLRSRWHAIWTGDRASYDAASSERAGLDADGDAARSSAALFAHYAAFPLPRLQLALGARADHLSDSYDARPDDPERSPSTSHTAVSPRAALTVRYIERPQFSGNAFVGVSRSFKAPTLDQLFDQRPIPLPFPPYSTTISNAQLLPQYGTGVEAGLYQSVALAGGGRLMVSLSGYETTMRDEVDFDVTTLRYVNIARSRHRGMESGVQWSADARLSLFVNHTLQSVTVLRGENSGNALKAIPRQLLGAGAAVHDLRGVDARVVVSSTGAAWLDDENSARLAGYTRTDLHLGYTSRGPAFFLEITNVFDARYSSTGYLDPAGTGGRYLSPAAGRVVQLGVRHAR